ncbi:MAG: PAC2 family protein [Chloroflexi bacterium]|nr:PAC2 family protein [Chloroflexota bacterium]MBV9600613.1 PAC2 family protein [Chloroflexota bacterium]
MSEDADEPAALRYLQEDDPLILRAPAALVAFGGWVDAGSGGTGGVRHLISNMKTRKVAEIDSEDFYSYTDTRPLVSIVGAGDRAVHWPRGEFHAAVVEEHTRDLLLFVAPEPNLKWQNFASLMLDGMQHFGVQSMTCIGSIFNAVSHRGKVQMTGWSNDEHLSEELAARDVTFTDYEGPTGFVTVLLSEAQKRGLPSAAVYGYAPSYIQGVPNPRVSHALLRTFSEISGVPLELRELERAGRALSRQVDRLLHDQPQLREQVERMLSSASEADAGQREEEPEPSSGPTDGPGVELPSPQAVVNELEEFLRQLRQEDAGDSDGN